MNVLDMFERALTERPGMSAGKQPALSLSRFAPSITIQTKILLCDVSYYQAVIDFVKMKAAGMKGVIIRVGQRNWIDTRFIENWAKAKAAGLPRGSYWLYDSRAAPKSQAALWWSLIKNDTGELCHTADLEEAYGGAYGKAADMQDFLQEFQRLSGLPNDKIVIYTGYYWWISRVGNIQFFKQYDLWLAWYAAMTIVRVPPPWVEGELLLWQYTSNGDGVRYGVGSLNLDLDWFFGDEAQYAARFGLNTSPPPPPNGDPMNYYEVRSTNAVETRSLRADHVITALHIDNLPINGTAKATSNDVYTYTADYYMYNVLRAKAGDYWVHVYEINSRPVNGWMAVKHLGVTYTVLKLISVTPPPPPAALPHIHFDIVATDAAGKKYGGAIDTDLTPLP